MTAATQVLIRVPSKDANDDFNGVSDAGDAPEVEGLASSFARSMEPLLGGLMSVSRWQEHSDSSVVLELLTMAAVENDKMLDEGYSLSVGRQEIRLSAHRPAGLFYALQTLLQLLPAQPHLEDPEQGQGHHQGASHRFFSVVGVLTCPACEIRDWPRFSWRGFMLDVARHFFEVDVIKRLIRILASYKVNRLHLHLSDDQGWRIAINKYPALTEIGASTSVGRAGGGFYSKLEYSELVSYCAQHHMILVPEIDVPGHTGAALSSIPELSLSPDGALPAVYEGVGVGETSLLTDHEFTYTWLRDVIREISELTPGPYFHIGGDEAGVTKNFVGFMERAQEIVREVTAGSKHVVAWEETAQAKLLEGTIIQSWRSQGNVDRSQEAVAKGAKIIMSWASRTYLDMKYRADDKLGAKWAGLIPVKHAYEWDPVNLIPGIQEAHILGVEAPLWTETVFTQAHIDYLMFPRAIGIAEIAWSAKPAGRRTWEGTAYHERLIAHAARLAISEGLKISDRLSF